MEIIKQCDYCSIGPELRLENSKIKKSFLGGLLSIIIGLLIVFLTIYLGIDIIYKENPNILVIEENIKEPIFYEFNSSNFFIGYRFAYKDISTVPDFDTYFDIKFYSYYQDNSDVTNVTVQFNKTKCSEYKNYYNELLERQVNSFNCPSDFDIKNLTLGGTESNLNSSRLWFEVYPCNNETKIEKTCKSNREREQLLEEGLYFVLLYRDYLINMKNSSHPISYFHVPLIIPLSNTFAKEMSINYKNILIKTDIGFMLEDLRLDTTIKFNQEKVEYLDNSKKNLPFLMMKIGVNTERLVYERKYLKVQELAASVGGLAKFLMVCATVLIYKINNKQINLTIMNELFDFAQENLIQPSVTKSQIHFQRPKSKNEMNKENVNQINILNNVSILSEHNNLSKNKIIGKKDSKIENLNLALADNSNINEKIFKNFDEKDAHRENKELAEMKNKEKDKNRTIIKMELHGRKKNSKLNYSFLQELSILICFCPKLQSNSVRLKEIQYNKCIEEVRQNMNMNYIVRRLNEIDFLKAILFSKEQILSFGYFHKPFVNFLNKEQKSDKGLINEIHQSLKLPEEKQLDILNLYYMELHQNNQEISQKDLKIMNLLDLEFS